MIYLISFNPSFNYLPIDVHNQITKMNGVTDWWHYLNYAYLIDSSLSVKTISYNIRTRFPKLLFLVIKVDLKEAGGLLNKGAWEWINRKNRVFVSPQKVNTSQPFSGLFRNDNKAAQKPPSLDDLLKKLNELAERYKK